MIWIWSHLQQQPALEDMPQQQQQQQDNLAVLQQLAA
jgi:hypothetical protein